MKIKYLSRFTIGLSIYLIVSAAFMRQFWEFLTNLLGRKDLQLICALLGACLSVQIIFYISRIQPNKIKLAASVFILALSLFFAWKQPYFVEKLHVLEYGLLGWFAARDFLKIPKIRIANTLAITLFFILIVGSIDEGFQKILPYRVGEIRDVITNVIGGSFGMALYILSR